MLERDEKVPSGERRKVRGKHGENGPIGRRRRKGSFHIRNQVIRHMPELAHWSGAVSCQFP